MKSSDLIERDGWWWPEKDRWAHCFIPHEVGPSISWLKEHNQRWGCIIQAGGNVGVYPKALSPLFDVILSFEPDDANYRCMQKNLEGIPFIRAALGEREGHGEVVEQEPENCGAHRIVIGRDVQIITIDSLGQTPDVIWLDVEGFELQALRGARQTLARSKPMVIVELKGLGAPYGYEDQVVHDYLGEIGYTLKSENGNDRMFV